MLHIEYTTVGVADFASGFRVICKCIIHISKQEHRGDSLENCVLVFLLDSNSLECILNYIYEECNLFGI
jgi:hypothetical protein